jgi:hypothetical protein
MVPTLIARTDGLPAVLLERERIWPVTVPPAAPRAKRAPSARERARIERQTAVVRECRLPACVRAAYLAQLAEQERAEIRSELAAAGLL